MPELLSIGECMIELFSEEPIEVADTFTRSLAGDSFNVLVAAQRLGTSTGYVTRLGDDHRAKDRRRAVATRNGRADGHDDGELRDSHGPSETIAARADFFKQHRARETR